MNNPHLSDPPLPRDMSEYSYLPIDMDNGGVHINMSIPSRAFVLMTEDFIGRDRAWRIWFRALEHYLSPTSNFNNAAIFVRRSAEDLYGSTSDWTRIRTSICNAFTTVGLNAECGGSAPPSYEGEYLFTYNPDADDLYGFFMPDTGYYDQYAIGTRFTAPSRAGLKITGVHLGIAYCWTLSDLDIYIANSASSGSVIYPGTTISQVTIPNDALWIAVADTSYVVSALFDQAISGDFFAWAYCPDSDPYPPFNDFILTAVDDASGGRTDGDRNVTTNDEGYWVTNRTYLGEDYNFLMAVSITYPGAEVEELLFPGRPESFAVQKIVPNPVNSMANITFSTPFEDAVLSIYDETGRRIRTLCRGSMKKGENTALWDGTDDKGKAVPSGVYLARLSNGRFKSEQKIILVK
jgi:hypothetical protein